MRLDDVDWRMLRGAIAALVACAGLGSGAVTASHYFRWQMEQAHQTQTGRLHGVLARYQAVDDEARLIESLLPRYRELEARGIVGPERRLDWVEGLRALSQQLMVPSVRYAIARQQAFLRDDSLETGAFQVYSSEMELELELLHEEDLTRLLSGLDERVPGLCSVERCEIRRLNDTFAAKPGKPNLSARCKLRWLTVRRRATPGGAS